MEKFFKSKFIGIDEALEIARRDRESINAEKLPRYNLPYLDELLIGIVPSELVIVGAYTGHGKSHLANHITLSNAQKGRTVHLFSLEGHRGEVVNRWKWQIICREYYMDPRGVDMHYGKYEMNLIQGIEREEQVAGDELKLLKGNMYLFDRSVGLTIDVLSQEIEKIEKSDLIVIDHLHYFNMFDDKTEAQNISEIMIRVKELTEDRTIPVVMISHLRKKYAKQGLPDNDDFMGSSNIAKVATTAIMVTPDPDNHCLHESRYSTIVRVTKSRMGASTTLAGQLMFDARLNQYEDNYGVGKVTGGKYKALSSDKWPYWAKKSEEVLEQ